MATKVSISNLALTILGADRITAMEDNNENARRLTAVYDYCLEDVLRAHPWNFAIKRQQLAELTTEPAFGYDNEFQLPSDCLRVIEVNDGTNIITKFLIEGRKLLTDDDSVFIKFIQKMTDPNEYTSQFIMVLSARLAAELAYAITNNKANAELIMQIYMDRLQKTKETDAQESDSSIIIDEDLWTIEKRA